MSLTIEIEVIGCEQSDINVTQQCENLTLEIIDAQPGDVTQEMFDDLESKVDINTADILNKVDKEVGKQLSDENFTLAEKNKLADVEAEATKNRADNENADKEHTHTIEQVTGLDTALADASISISGPRSVYTDRDYVYTITGLDSFTDYFVQVSEGSAYLSGNEIHLHTPSLDTALVLSIYAGSRQRDIVIDVQLSQYIETPTPTPANFGDPLEGGFYTGMIWNRIALSNTEQEITTGVVIFDVDQLGTLVYEGQMLEVRSVSDPFSKFIGTVAGASTGRITVDVASVRGSGTYSDWAIMARFRNIIAPKAQGESVPIALKFENTDMPTATQTLTEGWEATNAMLAAGTAAQYPAAHWARALVINGFSDWYIPARDELELAWRNLKPVTTDNYIGGRYNSSINYQKGGAYPDATAAQGVNLNSSPQSPAYTLTDSAQTSSDAFRAGGSEEFAWNNYFWTSSEASAAHAWGQFWYASLPGYQYYDIKATLRPVRAVRRSII